MSLFNELALARAEDARIRAGDFAVDLISIKVLARIASMVDLKRTAVQNT